MKVPLNWLRDYVNLPGSITPLVERLTLAGLEVGGVRLIGLPPPQGLHVKQEDRGPVWLPDKMFIGKVLQVERHPNADRLTLATVEYGASQPKTVVTGAPNLKVGDRGQKVIVALAGSVLFDGHADEKVRLFQGDQGSSLAMDATSARYLPGASMYSREQRSAFSRICARRGRMVSIAATNSSAESTSTPQS